MEQLEFTKPQINTAYGSIFIKNISMLDFATFDEIEGIVGNSMEVDILAKGKRDDKGFVYDFSLLKSAARDALINSIDHALVIPCDNSAFKCEIAGNRENWTLPMKGSRYNFDWTYSCPVGAVYKLESKKITKENLEKEVAKIILAKLPNTITEVEVQLLRCCNFSDLKVS